MKKTFLKSITAVLLFSAFIFGQVACDNMGDGDADRNDNDTVTVDTNDVL